MEVPAVVDGAALWPVSVKGVVRAGTSVLLALNEREEWELLGGRLEIGEDPLGTVVREVKEESGMAVDPTRLLDSWVYEIDGTRRVLIVAYDCPVAAEKVPRVSIEHRDVQWWPLHQLAGLNLPSGYRDAIERAFRASGSTG